MIDDQNIQRKCAFCLRADQPLIGPFAKTNMSKPGEDNLYFHKDCIEVNNYSFFNK